MNPSLPLTATAFAAAKVNLFLHVGAPDADGMHPLFSLMVFADVGDHLRLEPAAEFGLSVTGPFSEGLSTGEDNLVVRAARALLATPGPQPASFRLALDKQLPVASGLGGGSSDAGAALRLLRSAFRATTTDDDLAAVAAGLGSDGPACLFGRPVIAGGRGERLAPAPRFPPLDAVLVNPGVASPTAGVYRMFDQLGEARTIEPPALPDAFESAEALAEVLRGLRNDLEAPAVALNPVIGEALDLLGERDRSLLARVSGSGATCFALCSGPDQAAALAARLSQSRPRWWVRRCRLGGPWV